MRFLIFGVGVGLSHASNARINFFRAYRRLIKMAISWFGIERTRKTTVSIQNIYNVVIVRCTYRNHHSSGMNRQRVNSLEMCLPTSTHMGSRDVRVKIRCFGGDATHKSYPTPWDLHAYLRTADSCLPFHQQIFIAITNEDLVRTHCNE